MYAWGAGGGGGRGDGDDGSNTTVTGAAVVEGMVEVGEEKCSEHVCVVMRKD